MRRTAPRETEMTDASAVAVPDARVAGGRYAAAIEDQTHRMAQFAACGDLWSMRRCADRLAAIGAELGADGPVAPHSG